MTVYLVKDANTVSQHAWPGSPDLRPLTREGHRQAQALIALLRERQISKVVTSPALRSTETVSPLARVRDLDIDTVAALDEGATSHEALAMVRRLADERDGLVVCAASAVIDGILLELLAEGYTNEDGVEPNEGLVWVVEDSAQDAP